MDIFKIQGLNPVYWDIETTGFCAGSDRFGLAVFLDQKTGNRVDIYSIEDLYEFVSEEISIDDILVGFNTGNYKGGFDLPFLRYKFIKQDVSWPFQNLSHLDLSPIVSNHLNTKYYEQKLPSVSSLYKADLQDLAFENGIQYTNKSETYDKLMEMHENGETNWLGRDKIVDRSDSSLQYTYQTLFDPDLEEVYMDGAEMVDYIKEEKWDLVLEHCVNDVERLKTVTENLVPTIPGYYINREVTQL